MPGLRLLTCSLLLAVWLTGCGKSQNAAPIPVANAAAQRNSTGVTAAEPKARELIVTSPLDIPSEASFSDFSARIAQARKEQRILPCGNNELDRLYRLVTLRGFHGAGDAQEVNQNLEAWAKENSGDPTPQIALARASLEAAYLARGVEYGNVVSERRKERCALLMTTAHHLARQALEKQVSDPELFRVLILSGHELQVDVAQMAAWIREGQACGPTYYPLHEAVARVLKDRSPGRAVELAQFAEQALARLGGDDGLEAYTLVAMAVNQIDPLALLRSGFRLDQLNAGVKVLLRRYPQSALHVDFVAVVAYLSEDVPLAQSLAADLDINSINLYQWGDEQRFKRFQELAKQQLLSDLADAMVWPGVHGGFSLEFVRGGQQLVATPAVEAPIPHVVWPVNNLSAAPEVYPTRAHYPLHLDADQSGQHLLSYSPSNIQIFTHLIDLTKDEAISGMHWPPTYFPKFKRLGLHDPKQPEFVHFEIADDGNIAIALFEGEVKFFNPTTGQLIKKLAIPGLKNLNKWGRHLSADGKQLALQGKDVVEVWDVEQGKKLHDVSELTITTDFFQQFIQIQSNGKVLFQSMSKSKAAPVNNLSQWDPIAKATRHLNQTGKRLQPIASLRDEFVALASSTAGVPEIAVHRLADGKCMRTIRGHFKAIQAARFSPDGKWLGTLEKNGPVKLWRIPTAQ